MAGYFDVPAAWERPEAGDPVDRPDPSDPGAAQEPAEGSSFSNVLGIG